MSGWQLAREDILRLRGYKAAEQVANTIRLNANEAPHPILAGPHGTGLNRYPNVHPVPLQARMATLFEVPQENVLVTRGSSEAIDVLIRAFCTAYADNVITMPPTFEMYRFYANVQGIPVREIPLRAERDFAPDFSAVLQQCDDSTKLVFACSPNNPTGSMASATDIYELLEQRRDKSIIVVDEAYIEFSDRKSLAAATLRYDNLVVLRTLSKAQALAGARCGAAIACRELVEVFCRVLPPYSFPTPVIDSVIASLADAEIQKAKSAIAEIIRERERLYIALGGLDVVEKIWPSQANFLLVRVADMAKLDSFLQRQRILVRNFSSESGLENCARITIGSSAENDALLQAVRAFEAGE
jgi:histidinol-phosphate aminotransferase